MKIKKISDCFDSHGFFIIRDFDPCRMGSNPDPDKKALYDYLFDEKGYAIKRNEMINLISDHNKWPWCCDAIKYYYAGALLDPNCKGNYTAIYAWRH